MHSSPPRSCACGCGRAIPPNASAKRIWATDACRQRGHRGREATRARTRRASVQAAVEHRGPLDLAELLDVAQREARARPGSVVLRVAGRLVVLSADDLAQLAAGPAAAPAPQPLQALEQLRAPVEQLGRGVAGLTAWPEIGDGNRLVPADAISELQAQVDALFKALAPSPTV